MHGLTGVIQNNVSKIGSFFKFFSNLRSDVLMMPSILLADKDWMPQRRQRPPGFNAMAGDECDPDLRIAKLFRSKLGC